MTYIAKVLRIGLIALVTTILTAGIASEAGATVGKVRPHAHKFMPRNTESGLQLKPQQSLHLGALRYYGGPKSPMWREVR
jgi:hypothetical protein